MLLRTILLGMLLGVVIEALARLFRLWEFRHGSFVAIQIVLVYGLAMGTLAAWAPRLGAPVVALGAAMVGLCSELLNVAFLHWWRFCDGRDDSSWGRLATILVLALAWGTAPLVLSRADVALQSTLRTRSPQSALEELELRQRQLLHRREALLTRLRGIDNRLRAVDRRKQRLQERATRRERMPQTGPSNPATRDGQEEER